jgi:hypothetical protein
MSRRGKRLIWLGVIVTLALVAYGVVAIRYYALTHMKSVCATSDLYDLRMPFVMYRNDHDAMPTSWADMKGYSNSVAVLDAVSKELFVFFPSAAPGMLIIQPKPYRTALWPFGRFRQWGVDTNGYVLDFLGPRM